MAVNMKLDVDIGSFTSGIRQSQQILKGLNADMKAAEAEFKATGNAEQKMTSQTKTLNAQIQTQKSIADQARQALDAMAEGGVKPTDEAYQKLYVTMVNATAGMNNAQAALNDLRGGTENAKQGADDLTDSLKGIGNKISLEQVKSGIDSITNGLENAARKAVQLGQELWDMIMDSARRADDTATMADMYHIPLERFLQMQGLVGNGMDTTVDNMLAAQDKLAKGIGNKTATVIKTLDDLNLAYKQATKTGSEMVLVTQDQEQMFWLAGQAIMNMGEGYDKEAAATALFGKSWRELSSLFENYKSLEEYNDALSKVTVNDEKTIRDLAELNDAVGNLERSWTTLKDELLGSIAPALSKAAETVSGLLDKLTEYLKTDEGQAMLEKLGTAVSGLFDDLGNISPDQVIEGFVGVFDTLVEKIQWLSDHWQEVKTGIEGIGAAFLTLEGVSGLLTLAKVIDGLRDLGIIGGGGAAAKTAATMTAGEVGMKVSAAAAMGKMQLNAGQYAPALDWFLNDTALGTQIQNGIAEALGQEKPFADIDIAGEVSQGISDSINNTGSKEDAIAAYRLFVPFADLGRQIDDLTNPDSPVWNKIINPLGMLLPGIQLAGFMNQAAPSDQPITNFMGINVPVNPEADPNAAGEIAEQVGPVEIPVQLTVTSITTGGGFSGFANYFDNLTNLFGRGYANGLPNVPNDGLYRLHKGERVVPARAVSSQNYNSNLYVESMYMNNGTDAAGLAAAMAAAQRRQMSGYGS